MWLSRHIYISWRKMIHIGLLLAFWPGIMCQCEDNPALNTDLVFDPVFYLNIHPDLTDAGVIGQTQALNHWCTSGASEGRQATSMFHSVQYMQRYPDIADNCGSDGYICATLHYINNGFQEGRIGYVEGGSTGRFTVRSTEPVDGSYIYVSTSNRMAGAVDSVVWKNKEFINNFDHGRQLQMAITVRPNGECFNPTEAGGEEDYKGLDTKSVLISVEASGNRLQTINYPAYWIRGDGVARQPSGSGCPTGHPSYNTVDTHEYEMSKTVTIGCFDGDIPNCLEYRLNARLGDSPDMPGYTFAQLEGPTGYMAYDFTQAVYLNGDGSVDLIDLPPGTNNREDPRPVIIYTADEQFAMGGYTDHKDWPDGDGFPGLRYAYFRYPQISQFDRSTWKWSVVLRTTNLSHEDDSFIKTSYVCMGTLQMAIDCMITIAEISNNRMD